MSAELWWATLPRGARRSAFDSVWRRLRNWSWTWRRTRAVCIHGVCAETAQSSNTCVLALTANCTSHRTLYKDFFWDDWGPLVCAWWCSGHFMISSVMGRAGAVAELDSLKAVSERSTVSELNTLSVTRCALTGTCSAKKLIPAQRTTQCLWSSKLLPVTPGSFSFTICSLYYTQD